MGVKCRVIGDEMKVWKDLITSWILTAFSAFVPKRAGGRMGTAWMGLIAGLFDSLFSPTSKYFFSFSSLPTVCCLLLLLVRPHLDRNLSHPDAILPHPEAILSHPAADCSTHSRVGAIGPAAALGMRLEALDFQYPNLATLTLFLAGT
jgi:hypothetical protein